VRARNTRPGNVTGERWKRVLAGNHDRGETARESVKKRSKAETVTTTYLLAQRGKSEESRDLHWVCDAGDRNDTPGRKEKIRYAKRFLVRSTGKRRGVETGASRRGLTEAAIAQAAGGTEKRHTPKSFGPGVPN